ncbi:MAG: HAMP domain-containing histidine kinase, partial [Propionibacterium sp.]|nr:HAMP domain-containing histidine kinase [Propionibacterium sp.]
GQTITRDIWLDDKLVRVAMVSVRVDPDPRHGVLVVGIDLSTQRGEVTNSARTYVLVGLGTLLLSGLAGWVLAGQLMRPIGDLREATGRISAEDLTRRVPVNADADPDLVELALSFNATLDRLEEGFVAQRRFLDDVAHELRTPLTIIQGNLELLDENDPEDVTQTRELLMDELERMQRLVEDLLTLARAGRPDFLHLQSVSVPDFATEVMSRLRPLGDRRWGCVSVAPGRITADRQRLIQAVVQLAANAVKFTDAGDEITVSVRWDEPAPPVRARCMHTDRYLAVAVQDTGVGIAPEDQERIFERFGRTDSARRVDGSGLGLAIVSAIADAHGGTVQLESEPGEGSTFTLWLPGPAEVGADLDDDLTEIPDADKVQPVQG